MTQRFPRCQWANPEPESRPGRCAAPDTTLRGACGAIALAEAGLDLLVRVVHGFSDVGGECPLVGVGSRLADQGPGVQPLLENDVELGPEKRDLSLEVEPPEDCDDGREGPIRVLGAVKVLGDDE